MKSEVVAAIALAFAVGLLAGILIANWKLSAYKKILTIIGRNGGGYEKIRNKWYRITECEDRDLEIVEDMGIPQRMHH